MKIFIVILIIFVILMILVGWCTNDSHHPLPVSRYEKVEINVYIRQGQERFKFLGNVIGISACQSMVQEFIQEKNLDSKHWQHTCCTVREGSHCYDKIR